MIAAYRICQSAWLESAFSGEGARRYGGRWNSVGTRMVYTAGSRSLATLEILVHAEDMTCLENRYQLIAIEFPQSLMQPVAAQDLPEHWDSPQPPVTTQLLGDAWIRGGASAVLQVPSAVTQEEFNYLLNPAHPDFARIQLGAPHPLRLDSRLF